MTLFISQFLSPNKVSNQWLKFVGYVLIQHAHIMFYNGVQPAHNGWKVVPRKMIIKFSNIKSKLHKKIIRVVIVTIFVWCVPTIAQESQLLGAVGGTRHPQFVEFCEAEGSGKARCGRGRLGNTFRSGH